MSFRKRGSVQNLKQLNRSQSCKFLKREFRQKHGRFQDIGLAINGNQTAFIIQVNLITVHHLKRIATVRIMKENGVWTEPAAQESLHICMVAFITQQKTVIQFMTGLRICLTKPFQN